MHTKFSLRSQASFKDPQMLMEEVTDPGYSLILKNKHNQITMQTLNIPKQLETTSKQEQNIKTRS
jgi:hypothetical protein